LHQIFGYQFDFFGFAAETFDQVPDGLAQAVNGDAVDLGHEGFLWYQVALNAIICQ
jgi:hypothetical protein